MISFSDDELYRRGTQTLLACWAAYARGTIGASVQYFPGVTAAIFPHEPERAYYNNALLGCDLTASARGIALAAMEVEYSAAGITAFAAWVHEEDAAMRIDLQRRGYRFSEATRAMGMALDNVHLPSQEVDLGSLDWTGYLRLFGLPPDLFQAADHTALNLVVARLDGLDAAAALAYDHAGDCGIFNVTTVAHARRRGLATALTALQLRKARARGCRTASLQSTPMAEHVYAAVGFRDLGQILDYTP
jgi:GNAT superfamily N-acetyltransferase